MFAPPLASVTSSCRPHAPSLPPSPALCAQPVESQSRCVLRPRKTIQPIRELIRPRPLVRHRICRGYPPLATLRAPRPHPRDLFHTQCSAARLQGCSETPVSTMESPLRLAFCLLTCCQIMQAGPVGAPECDLKPIAGADLMDVMYTHTNALKGCVSKGSTQEVHVLNVRQSQELTSPIKVELKKGPFPSTDPVLIINIKGFMMFKSFPEGINPMVYVPAESYATTAVGYQLLGNNSMELPTDSQQLLHWAQETFGSVTSFVELQNPRDIRLTVGRNDGSPDICSLQDAFSAKGFLEWDSAPKVMTSCQIFGEGGPSEAHILQVIDDPEGSSSGQTDIEVRASKTDCVLKEDQVLLILQSQNNRQWAINTQHPLTVMASEESSVLSSTSISQAGMQPLSTPEQLIRLAREKGFQKIWYTQMSSVQHVTIQLQNCENNGSMTEMAVDSTTPAAEPIKEQIAHFFNLLNPWGCTKDYLSITLAKDHIRAAGFELTHVTLLDPSCQADQNGTHIFLTTKTDACQTSIEEGNQVMNQLFLTVKTEAEPVEVPVEVQFACLIPTVELKVYQNADFSTPSDSMEAEVKTYAEVSVSGVLIDALVRIQECSFTPGSEDSRVLIVRGVQKLPNVEVLEAPEVESNRQLHRFSFTYQAGMGPSACTGVLACELCMEPEDPINCPNSKLIKTSLNLSISNHNVSGQDQGLGTLSVLGITFGAFLIGALLTAALWFIYSHTRPSERKQLVSMKPAASESSSANHSIGSTQSTPCSTSSMA